MRKNVIMKIVVTAQKSVKGKGEKKLYNIVVLDGNTPIHEELVHGVSERDKTVWQLADLYSAVDIEMNDNTIAEDFMFSEIPSIPVLEEEEASEFFEDNKDFVYDRIMQAVEEGIRSKQDNIRLFELNGTGVYITSNKPDWKHGVEQALEYFVLLEHYDKCIQARQLLSSL